MVALRERNISSEFLDGAMGDLVEHQPFKLVIPNSNFALTCWSACSCCWRRKSCLPSFRSNERGIWLIPKLFTFVLLTWSKFGEHSPPKSLLPFVDQTTDGLVHVSIRVGEIKNGKDAPVNHVVERGSLFYKITGLRITVAFPFPSPVWIWCLDAVHRGSWAYFRLRLFGWWARCWS